MGNLFRLYYVEGLLFTHSFISCITFITVVNKSNAIICVILVQSVQHM